MRLASLFGPDAIAHAPRAARYAAPTATCASSVGLQALTRAIAEIERLPDAARTPGVAASYDEVTQMVNPRRQPGIGRAAHSRHDVEDGRPQRDRLPPDGAVRRRRRRSSARLLAIQDGDDWTLGVVRRMQRQQVDEVTVGVEIIARRLVRVLMRSWVDAVGSQRARARDRPFFGIYLPAHPREPAGVAAQPHRPRRQLHPAAAWSSSTPATRAT